MPSRWAQKNKLRKISANEQRGLKKSAGEIGNGHQTNFISFLVALSLGSHHEQAVEIRENDVLPTYRERLGDHPFTATILNNLSNNYRDLGKIEATEQYVEEALKIRLKLLGVHRDTAKSLFDLGMVLKEKGEFQEAKTYLEKCKEMQEEVADDDSIVQQ